METNIDYGLRLRRREAVFQHPASPGSHILFLRKTFMYLIVCTLVSSRNLVYKNESAWVGRRLVGVNPISKESDRHDSDPFKSSEP